MLAAVLHRLRNHIPARHRAVVRRAVFLAIAPFFRGDAVQCPCCSRGARRWVSLWLPNAVCPHCSSLERNRSLMLYLRDRTRVLREPVRLLHFAAEPCLVGVLRAVPTLDYVPADLDPPRGALRLDITAMALPTGSVDAIIASHVLEHVPGDRAAMAEMRRVLRPGGEALLMVPMDETRLTHEDPAITAPTDRLREFGQEDHVRMYGTDFVDRLQEAGFTVRVEHYARDLGPAAIARHGLDAHDGIYVCS